MSSSLKLILPAVSLDEVSAGLRHLTQALAQSGVDPSHGLLGGQWGYGAEFTNDVFEMHPYWWGECECGLEDREAKWDEEHPEHAPDCYQSELLCRGGYDFCEQLAQEWGLPYEGCAVHCTCGLTAAYQAWLVENGHRPTCPVVRPNFRHHVTGFEVRWYKYLNRGMEVVNPSSASFAFLLDDCLKSLPSSSLPQRQLR